MQPARIRSSSCPRPSQMWKLRPFSCPWKTVRIWRIAFSAAWLRIRRSKMRGPSRSTGESPNLSRAAWSMCRSKTRLRARAPRHSMIVSIHPEADAELLAAAVYYAEHAGRKVADDFLAEFDHAVSLLRGFPGLGTPWRGRARRFPVRRFRSTTRLRRAPHCRGRSSEQKARALDRAGLRSARSIGRGRFVRAGNYRQPMSAAYVNH